MKMWRHKFEWMGYASCLGDDRFTSDDADNDDGLEEICAQCRVRPECAQWAADENVSAVFVCGVRLPDPAEARQLRKLRTRLAQQVPNELNARGEDI